MNEKDCKILSNRSFYSDYKEFLQFNSKREKLNTALDEIKNTFNCFKICVDAQKQASGFYEKCGFVQTSGEFLEEGVVHIKMEKTL